jgi:6-phosphofructokinase 1
MVAIRDGKFSHTTLPDPTRGARRVDVERQYDTDRYRPRYAGRLGFSLFLESTD